MVWGYPWLSPTCFWNMLICLSCLNPKDSGIHLQSLAEISQGPECPLSKQSWGSFVALRSSEFGPCRNGHLTFVHGLGHQKSSTWQAMYSTSFIISRFSTLPHHGREHEDRGVASPIPAAGKRKTHTSGKSDDQLRRRATVSMMCIGSSSLLDRASHCGSLEVQSDWSAVHLMENLIPSKKQWSVIFHQGVLCKRTWFSLNEVMFFGCHTQKCPART